MSSEFDRDMYFFQYFHGDDQEPFDFNEYCSTGDYLIDPTIEAQTLDHPAAVSGNECFNPDASVGVLEPNQASLHERQSAVVPGSNQSESTYADDMRIDSTGSPPPPGPPYKCTEANCKSKAQFKNLSQFRQHVRNKHQQPLVCTVPGCPRKQPFGRQTDLNRHVKTQHKHEATEIFLCADESCPAHVHGFERKDKLLKHLREQHPQVQCTQTHCSAIVADFQQQSHMEQAHGPFECALGHCRSSPPSKFTRVGLKQHLKKHHKLSHDGILGISTRMESSDLDVRSEHLLDGLRRAKWEKCSVCEIGGATAPINGDV
ncbi:unnamed protein product [Clonostachys rhizophaga]|uniref:C2H2-type domain-containing protein n=1 Tax=Clonostachys rhizophaga TaxID=160324 RepID=A0A9N9VT35_9HYPO|nr:unnamed protein product [Clonostachys rhizophaga]